MIWKNDQVRDTDARYVYLQKHEVDESGMEIHEGCGSCGGI